MLERVLNLINILVGSCGGIAFLLWIVATYTILGSRHPRDGWEATLVQLASVAIFALIFIIPALGWLYVAGFFS